MKKKRKYTLEVIGYQRTFAKIPSKYSSNISYETHAVLTEKYLKAGVYTKDDKVTTRSGILKTSD